MEGREGGRFIYCNQNFVLIADKRMLSHCKSTTLPRIYTRVLRYRSKTGRKLKRTDLVPHLAVGAAARSEEHGQHGERFGHVRDHRLHRMKAIPCDRCLAPRARRARGRVEYKGGIDVLKLQQKNDGGYGSGAYFFVDFDW